MQHAYSIYIQEAGAKSNIAVATHIQIVKRLQAMPNAVFILTVHSLEIAPCNTSKIREDSWHFFSSFRFTGYSMQLPQPCQIPVPTGITSEDAQNKQQIFKI